MDIVIAGETVAIFFILLFWVLFYEWFLTKHRIGIWVVSAVKAKFKAHKCYGGHDIGSGKDCSLACKVVFDSEGVLRVVAYTVVNHLITEDDIKEIVAMAGTLTDFGYKPLEVLEQYFEEHV